MVIALRHRDPMIRGNVSLNNILLIADLSELYYQFGEYRLEMLEARIKHELKVLRAPHAAGEKTDTRALKEFLDEQIERLPMTNEEIVEDEKVVSSRAWGISKLISE